MIYTTDKILPFVYMVSITLSASKTGQTQIQLDQDSTFEWLRTYAVTSVDTATDVIPNYFSVTISDQTGKVMSNARVPQGCLYPSAINNGGSDEKYPIRLPAGAIINLDFLELSGGSNTIYLGLRGYKLF